MEFMEILVQQAPNLIGLGLLALVLYRQVNRLLDELLGRLDAVETAIVELQANMRDGNK